ncbi:hypothetical protein JQF37_01825 [Pseudomonas sp. MIL9]|uniref:hypothetical protein n=1 Tax=Pseudomonas sp. MIL9 TaxID=2807620 RepID=UPI00194E8313|nr:hypothetical protein [Pseudomonas sp. MIL9]MBM6442366.1 hypothetical protein [Pseudomonas sp. MIL9]
MLSLFRSACIIAVAALLLSGCASGPTQQEISSAYYGSAPSQSQAESEIKGYFGRVLKDPYSAQYQFSQPRQGYMIGNAFEGRKLYTGFIIFVDVNARNSFGGYTGNKSYQFLFKDGRMIRGLEVLPQGTLSTLF